MTDIETIRDAIRFLRGGYDDQSTVHVASEHERAALEALARIEAEVEPAVYACRRCGDSISDGVMCLPCARKAVGEYYCGN